MEMMMMSGIRTNFATLRDYVENIESADNYKKEIKEACTAIEKYSSPYDYPFVLFKGFEDSFAHNKKLSVFFGNKFLTQSIKEFDNKDVSDQTDLIKKTTTAKSWINLKGNLETMKQENNSDRYHYGFLDRISLNNNANKFFKKLNKKIKKEPEQYLDLVKHLEFGETAKGALTPESTLIHSYVVGIGTKAEWMKDEYKLNTTDIFGKHTITEHHDFIEKMKSNICFEKRSPADLSNNQYAFCCDAKKAISALSNLTS